MDVGLLDQHGDLLRQRHMPASPETFLQVIAPSRDALVVAVAGLVTWYGLADRCLRAGMACVLGPALSMKAMHGGKANNENMDSQKLAVLLRGGLLPQA